MQLPWDTVSEPPITILKLLLFADDVALLATSIKQLQLALNLMAVWAERRGIKWGHRKCMVMRLSRARGDKTTREQLPKVTLEGHVLDWAAEFKYLGLVTKEAPEYRHRLAACLSTDPKKIRPLCFALLRMFPSTARCVRAAPLVARLGILQVIHAKFLYPTALNDVDYAILDRQTNRCLRNLCGLPVGTPSVLLHADIGVWPSKYYAHKRALTFLYRLRWQYWTHMAFQQWFDSSPPDTTPPCLRPEWCKGGVLARYGMVLAMYGFSWEDLRDRNDEGWNMKVTDAIHTAFEEDCRAAAEKYHHPWLEYPAPAKEPRMRHCLRFGGDLALACLRMRSPRLRLVPSYKPTDHGVCRYCKEGPENGAHLILCDSMPSAIRSSRDRIIDAICDQAGLPRRVRRVATRRGKQAIQDYIMTFSWPNMTNDLLKQLLVFCRNLINKYADFKPDWESPEMEAYPVRRVRPFYRKPSSDEKGISRL
jgi:hypothetical protein